MKKFVVSLFLVLVLIIALIGCVTDTSGNKSVDANKVATGMAMLKNALALAQVGYMDYALISGKSADPKTLGAMQIIDQQLNVLGALAYNVAQPTPADVERANQALKDVEAAKAQIALAQVKANPTK